jgi:hypothetical protein
LAGDPPGTMRHALEEGGMPPPSRCQKDGHTVPHRPERAESQWCALAQGRTGGVGQDS